jgi:hypothetical protein
MVVAEHSPKDSLKLACGKGTNLLMLLRMRCHYKSWKTVQTVRNYLKAYAQA